MAIAAAFANLVSLVKHVTSRYRVKNVRTGTELDLLPTVTVRARAETDGQAQRVPIPSRVQKIALMVCRLALWLTIAADAIAERVTTGPSVKRQQHARSNV